MVNSNHVTMISTGCISENMKKYNDVGGGGEHNYTETSLS